MTEASDSLVQFAPARIEDDEQIERFVVVDSPTDEPRFCASASDYLETVLLDLASAHADHPECQQHWRD